MCPREAALAHAPGEHWNFLSSTSHINTSRCSLRAAQSQTSWPTGQPLSKIHFTVSRVPHLAVTLYMSVLQGHPFSRAHLIISRRFFGSAMSYHLIRVEPRGLCLLAQSEPKNLQIIQIQPNAKKDCQLRKGQRRGRGETGAETESLLITPHPLPSLSLS